MVRQAPRAAILPAMNTRLDHQRIFIAAFADQTRIFAGGFFGHVSPRKVALLPENGFGAMQDWFTDRSGHVILADFEPVADEQ